jgi:hypothetical protein
MAAASFPAAAAGGEMDIEMGGMAGVGCTGYAGGSAGDAGGGGGDGGEGKGRESVEEDALANEMEVGAGDAARGCNDGDGGGVNISDWREPS